MMFMSHVARTYSRAIIWFLTLRRLSPTSLSTALGMLLSMIVDIALCLCLPLFEPLLKGRFSGIVYSKEYQVYYSIRDGSDDLYLVLPRREGDVSNKIFELLSEGDTFVDVGANVGCYSIPASRIVGDSGHVIAVEPVPTTAGVLMDNCKLNDAKNVTVINKACWNCKDEITIWVPNRYYGLASSTKHRTGEPFIVPTAQLDDICKGYSSIKVLKIDVEGSEMEVLRGASKTLSRTDYVVIETSEEPSEVLSILEEASFSVRKMRFTTYWLAKKPKTNNGDAR